MPRRWRTTLWSCAAFSRVCVCASARPCDTSPARATAQRQFRRGRRPWRSPHRTAAAAAAGVVSAASRPPTSACAKAATLAGSGASGHSVDLRGRPPRAPRPRVPPARRPLGSTRPARAGGRAAAASSPAAGAACPTSRCRCGRRCRSRPRSTGSTGRGVELGPAVRPGAARDRHQRRVEPVDRVAAVGDRRRPTGRTRLRSVIGGGRCDSNGGAGPATGRLGQRMVRLAAAARMSDAR